MKFLSDFTKSYLEFTPIIRTSPTIELDKLKFKTIIIMVVFTNLADHDLSVDPGEHQHSEKLGELELK